MKTCVVGVVLLVAITAGCSSAEQDEAVAAADRFVSAVAEGDGPAACELLAPVTLTELEQTAGKPCDEAVLEEARDAGDRVDADTFGTMSAVRYREDVLFLSRFGDDWRVLAAACTKQPAAPYDCQIAGR